MEWLGEKGRNEEIEEEWMKIGKKIVVIKKGENGDVEYKKNEKVNVKGVKVDVVDKVGEGEKVNEGIMERIKSKGIMKKEEIEKMREEKIN